MGFAPEQVQRMSLWEFHSAFAAWKRFNGIKTEGGGEVTLDRLKALGVK
ncbi:hypothetical protein [Ketogulonicigenium vulgare]|uniref:Uncharacterized protein n=1 Tax=Ketogulonicigenium vulgare (strain WSH-001) TaxID=759362 RepID=F9Y9R8_KETVW|nr:hypothetical protein [Ketogulonicigenium vulgare]ADO43115.1 hypothetical protein EIO_2006 [Ketogulonicigenium vulgare Y25]AEM41406.1 hypothetical protein KVU_1567 [Ketogulonicigenium vulgare WSH-001]ALJ81540.1 hypothetical protein KVH_10350 [Ketogulonicigenium vulgare]ANW35112.1 hypothetical protein KvSKV_10290 [Ketogulonicigenium vulgare]AOZ55150.1 hypothetical protein KVC_2143 [Ketogulonicigenium vulgare]